MAAAREAGRQPEDVTCVYNLDVRVDERASPEPLVVSGSADAAAERLLDLAAIGFTALSFLPAGTGQAEQIERLGREVLPVLREARV